MDEQINYYQAKLKYEIDSWDLFDKLNRKEQIQIIDAHLNEAFEQEHIPGAINIPHRTMNEKTCSKLNKNILYVIFCDGISCNASTKGALNMTQMGFCVKEFLGGRLVETRRLSNWGQQSIARENVGLCMLDYLCS